MSKIEKETILENYPLPVTIEATEVILHQMKKCICKIENKNGSGTGFFCHIPYKGRLLEVMITNNHILNKEILKNDKIIKLLLNDSKENITLEIKDRKIYTSKKYDTTIIEINSEKDKIYNFLEIDQEIFDKNINMFNKSIYILQYHRNIDKYKAAVSYGILKNMEDKYNIIHYCCTDQGSSGSPILKISNKKIIGIHSCNVKNSENYYNRGTLLKYRLQNRLCQNRRSGCHSRTKSFYSRRAPARKL